MSSQNARRCYGRRSTSNPLERAACASEMLEPRLLLAGVSWDGGGGDGQWINPLNWSTDALPGPADDVTVAGANVTLAGSAQAVNSFNVAADATVRLRQPLSAA